MNWTCPYCHRPQTLTSAKVWSDFAPIRIQDTALGNVAVVSTAYGCANNECEQLTLYAHLEQFSHYPNGSIYRHSEGKYVFSQRLLPKSIAKPQPDYIPAQIREDYQEACAILDLSPKASATLSRRCLQGMIRDFTKIARPTLNSEISDLKKAVESGTGPQGVSFESVAAIDHVRTIGNIGAHMEKDVELIIPVEPGEAQLLVELTESLFDEWYVARHVRQKRFEDIARVAENKKLAKKPQAALPPPEN